MGKGAIFSIKDDRASTLPSITLAFQKPKPCSSRSMHASGAMQLLEGGQLLLDRVRDFVVAPSYVRGELLFSARFSGRGQAGHFGPLSPLPWPLWPVCLIRPSF